MADFTSDNTPIQASRKRVVALYKAVVDRIDLKSTSRFSGFAVLVTVFTVSANYQYHLVYYRNSSNDNNYQLLKRSNKLYYDQISSEYEHR